jgi:hypothetical protein
VHQSRRLPALVAVLLAIAAAASAEPLRLSAPPLEQSRSAGAVVDALTGAVLGLAVAAAVMLATLLLSGLRRRSDPERRPAAVIRLRAADGVVIAVMLAVAIGALVAALALVPRDRRDSLPTGPLPLIGGGAREVTRHGGWEAAGLLLVLGAAVAVIVVVRRGRRRAAPTIVRPLQSTTVEARSSDPVAWAADPREAVLQAYAVGEAALADRGLDRASTETPREYLSRVGGAPLHTLTAGYEVARFADHAIAAETRRTAIEAAELLQRGQP